MADQLAQFRVWFEEFDSALFDQKIRRDAVSGKLDRLAEQAIDEKISAFFHAECTEEVRALQPCATVS